MCNFMEDIKLALKQANKRSIEELMKEAKKHDELVEKQLEQLLKEIPAWISSLSLSLENRGTLYLGLHLFRLPSEEIVMYVSLTNSKFSTNYHQLSFKNSKELELSDFFIHSQNLLSPIMRKVQKEKAEVLRAFFKGIFIESQELAIPGFYEIINV